MKFGKPGEGKEIQYLEEYPLHKSIEYELFSCLGTF